MEDGLKKRAKDGFVIENGILKEFKGNAADLVIPEGVKVISKGAMISCPDLKSISFPNSLERIENMAFLCESPLPVFIPAGVREIYGNAFFGGVSKIDVDPENRFYRSSNNCLIEKQSKTLVFCCKGGTIPEDGSVEAIGKFAFGSLFSPPDFSAGSLTIPEGVKEIKKSGLCFADIKSVTLPESLEIIGENAFMDCHRLESVIIPERVKTIGDLAFDDDWELRVVAVLGDNVEFGEDVFSGCDDLVICANKGSSAEEYAKKYGVPFEAL